MLPKEAPDFKHAIRGLENITINKPYVIVRSHLSGGNQRVRFHSVELKDTNIGIKWVYYVNGDRDPHFLADCGVIQYDGGGWNPTNYIMEDPISRKFDDMR